MDSKITDAKAFPTEALRKTPATGLPASGESPTASVSEKAAPEGLPADASCRNWIGKEAGFPETFLGDCKTCFRQIFRIYAHLYHSHWVDPYWHLTNGSNAMGWTDLNSCFVHFITVAKLYGLLSEKDAEPMQPLLDIWIGCGALPIEAVNATHRIVTR